MKKHLKYLLVVFGLLLLVGCGKNEETVMLIEEAQLTEEEENILKLIELDKNLVIYDINLDSEVKSYKVTTYRLKDGKWQVVASGASVLKDPKLRISLSFDKISEGISIGNVSESSSGIVSYGPEEKIETEGMAVVTSRLDQLREISYGEELPLVGQVISKKDTIEFKPR